MLPGSTGRFSITNLFADTIKPAQRVGIISSVILLYDMVNRTCIESVLDWNWYVERSCRFFQTVFVTVILKNTARDELCSQKKVPSRRVSM